MDVIGLILLEHIIPIFLASDASGERPGSRITTLARFLES